MSAGGVPASSPRDRLAPYRGKRDFTRTPEPPPGPSAAAPAGGTERELAGGAAQAPRFVVQQHAARRMHYDLRFEADGVLVSFAVPRGPSYDPAAKRLAVHVEDHPVDYREFEGTIPAGEYGGGSVIVWDEGTYENRTAKGGRPVPFAEGVAAGHVSVWLEGRKLRGGWALTRTGRRAGGGGHAGGGAREDWLLVKRQDDHADPARDVEAEAPRSVLSGRLVGEVGGDDDPVWTRRRATFVPPMLAESAKSLPERSGDFLYDRKLDGLRAVAVRNGDEVELWSRNHRSYAQRFPRVVAALAGLPVDNLTLDGELVAYEGDATSFERLQRAGSSGSAVYEVFDVLHLLGTGTEDLPLEDRRALVTQLLAASPDPAVLRALDPLAEGPAGELLARACEQGWEGLVAKRRGSPYRSGRSGDWRKLKCDASQELVIGGYTEPKGSRQHIGALLVGYHDSTGDLRYAGKVGSGLDDAMLARLEPLLRSLAVREPPFADLPRDGRSAAHFVAPQLVCQVVFSEWTAEGRLRHPRFAGLREDKPAAEVVREAGATRQAPGRKL